jgi:predicted Zn-dependent protease
VQAPFYELAAGLFAGLAGGEVLTCWFAGERSAFVSFNRGKLRQPGSVEQRYLSLRLISGGRQAHGELALAGDAGDLPRARQALGELRAIVADLPPDPHLLYATEVRSSEHRRPGALAPPEAVAAAVVDRAAELDLVGLYAAGTICNGFANSLGQRNWHEVDSFHLDWSLYARADKAVKSSYAGLDWSPAEFGARLERSREALALIQRPPREIAPGEYRAFLAPQALEEILGMLSWGGFSGKARATKRSPLLRMERGTTLNPAVTLAENIGDGLAPAFQSDGYVKPERVTLVDAGRLGDALVSPRTAKEYGLATNGASGHEAPLALDMAPGDLAGADVLARLDTGLYVNNLWYLNFSDRPACRLTGMTRFATFWVENGKIVAPINVMRFDDGVYRMLGENLLALTREREWRLDEGTYGQRSTGSTHLPGALIDRMRFTL